MATAITASDYYSDTTALRADVDSILLVRGIVDPQLAGRLTNVIYKQHKDKCDAAATASAL